MQTLCSFLLETGAVALLQQSLSWKGKPKLHAAALCTGGGRRTSGAEVTP